MKEALIKCQGGVLGQVRHVHFRIDGDSVTCTVPGYAFSLLPAPEGYAAALCWEKLEENRCLCSTFITGYFPYFLSSSFPSLLIIKKPPRTCAT